jgi:uncharacterized membrane protein
MRLIALAAPPAAMALILAAACSSETAETAPAAKAAAPAPVLAGVDLTQSVRALGTEPFWSVELNGREMVYSGVDHPERRAPQPRAVIQGTIAAFEGDTAEGPLEIILTATECSDGMSDRTYPLTAIVRVGEESLTGCAASTAAIMSAGERGPVGEPAQPAA